MRRFAVTYCVGNLWPTKKQLSTGLLLLALLLPPSFILAQPRGLRGGAGEECPLSNFGAPDVIYTLDRAACTTPGCSTATIQCLDKEDLREITKSEAEATAHMGLCIVYAPKEKCRELGILPDFPYEIDSLEEALLDSQRYPTYAETNAACLFVHELSHLKDGCMVDSCTTEDRAYQKHGACFRSHAAYGCGGRGSPWSQQECAWAESIDCHLNMMAEFNACRCRIDSRDFKQPCSECYSECLERHPECGTSEYSTRCFCSNLNALYCDGVIPRATPTPEPTPTTAPTCDERRSAYPCWGMKSVE